MWLLVYAWNWGVIERSMHYLLGGLLTTVWVCVGASIIMLLISPIVAAARLSRSKLLRGATTLYLDFFRTTPFLVQLMWFFFALPILTGFYIDGLQAGILGLGVYMAAYQAEVVRAGILAVPAGQHEAAFALGMNRLQVYRRILLPQAVARMIPPTMTTMSWLVKESAIVSAVSVTDLMFRANAIASLTYRAVEPLTAAAFGYSLIILPLVLAGRWLHARQRRWFE